MDNANGMNNLSNESQNINQPSRQDFSNPVQNNYPAPPPNLESQKPKSKLPKFVVIGTLIVIVLAGLIFGANALLGNNDDSPNQNQNQNQNNNNSSSGKLTEMIIPDEYFDATNPIPIKKDGKYGYIDNKGNIIIQPRFTAAADFHGKYALVREEVDSKIETFLIDRDGNKKMDLPNTDVSPYNINASTISIMYGAYLFNDKLYNVDLGQITPENSTISDSIGLGYYLLETTDQQSKKHTIINSFGETIYELGARSYHIHEEIIGNDLNYKFLLVTEAKNSDAQEHRIINLNTGSIVYSLKSKELYTFGGASNLLTLSEDKQIEVAIVTDNDKITHQFTDNDLREIKNINYLVGHSPILKIEYNDNSTKFFNLETKKETPKDEALRYGISGYNVERISILGYEFVDQKTQLPNNKEIDLSSYVGQWLPRSATIFNYLIKKNQIVPLMVNGAHSGAIIDLLTGGIINTRHFPNMSTYSPFIYTSNLFNDENSITSVFDVFSKKSIEINDKLDYGYFGPTYFRLSDGSAYSSTPSTQWIYYNLNLEKIYETTEAQ